MLREKDWFCWAPDGSAGAAPVGEGQPAAGSEAVAKTDTIAGISELTQSINALLAVAKQRPAPAAEPAKPAVEPEDEEEVDAKDLEVMPRAEFAEYLVNKILKAVNKQVVEPINTRLTSITADTGRNQITQEVARLGGVKNDEGKYVGGKYADFWEFSGEMQELAKENPGTSIERLYRLAKAENPKKAADVAAKSNPPKLNGGKVKLSFGGLTPAQSGTGSRGGKMKGGEASELAWADTVAALGGTPSMFGEDE